jgi:hypothetical protein
MKSRTIETSKHSEEIATAIEPLHPENTLFSQWWKTRNKHAIAVFTQVDKKALCSNNNKACCHFKYAHQYKQHWQ